MAVSNDIEHRAFWKETKEAVAKAYNIVTANIERELMKARKEQETKTFLPKQ